MSWVGGKKALRDEIVIRLNRKCDRYVEVFGGGGWVLFHKPPGKFEVYNDFNPNLANLYRCVREHPKELCEELRYTLNSRLDFEYIRTVLHSKAEIPDIRRAAWCSTRSSERAMPRDLIPSALNRTACGATFR